MSEQISQRELRNDSGRIMQGRHSRRRLADLLIASIALANDLPLITRNRADFAELDGLVEVIEI